MDVVPDSSSIFGRIICPENRQRNTGQSRVNCQGNKMCFRVMAFSELPGSTCRVEVAQSYPSQTVGFFVRLEDAFDEQFAFTVGIHWALGMPLRNGQFFGNAICGAC